MKLALAVAAAILALIGTAHAGPVPDAVAYLNPGDVPPSLLVNAIQDPVTGLVQVPFGTYTNIDVPGEILAGDAFSVSLSTNLSIGALTTASSPYCCGPEVQAQISYFFDVTGPTNVSVPLNITGLLDASGDDGLGLALVSVGVGGGTPVAAGDVFGNEGLVLADACNEFNPYACGNQGFVLSLPEGNPPFSTPFMVPSNTVEEIDLELFVGTNLGSASGFIDPVITIDPTFLANNPGFSLVLSSNIQQGPPTAPAPSSPEPASLALLGMGLAGIGVIRRRRASR